MSGSGKKYRGHTDEAYPDVFNNIPEQPKEKKPGQLSREQLKQYFEEGFVLIENFYEAEELKPCKEAVKLLVDKLAQKLYDAGKITKLYKDLGFYQRMTQIDKEFPGAGMLLHKLVELPQAFRDVWANERMLNVAEQIIGPHDIAGHPVWNLRVKVPKNQASTVPWHQDCGYLDQDSYKVMQLTAWIPLLDATEHNGCMQLMKYGHKEGRIAKHTACWEDTHYIMLSEDEMRKTLKVDPDKHTVTCPVPYRSVLLLNNAVPHRSLANLSKDIRWSLDLRWQRADKSVGFYGLKDGILMRSKKPGFKLDWEPFIAVNRHQKAAGEEPVDEFDTTCPGPWIRNWELVHSNRHSDALAKQEALGKEESPKTVG